MVCCRREKPSGKRRIAMYPEKEMPREEEKVVVQSVAPQEPVIMNFEAEKARIAALDESARSEEYNLLRNRAQAALDAAHTETTFETLIPCLLCAAEHFSFNDFIKGASEEGWQLSYDALMAAEEAGMLPSKRRRSTRRRQTTA